MRDRLNALAKTGYNLFGRFRCDQSGSYLVISGVVMPALVGLVGLGTDYGLWTYTHQNMQSAADSAAMSAAAAYAASSTNSVTTQANAVTSSYTDSWGNRFVNGVNGVAVTVNRPPQSGGYTSKTGAVEVIIQQAQSPIFSAFYQSNQVTVTARAVALGNDKGCVLALNATASGAISVQGSNTVTLNNCSLYNNSNDATSALSVGGSSNLTAFSVNVLGGVSGQSHITTSPQANNIVTGASPLADPYAGVAQPSPTGTIYTSNSYSGSTTIYPGIYQGGIKLSAHAALTLNAGTYFIECPCSGGSGLDMAGGASMTGSGVTLVFTSSNGSSYATASISGGATMDLSAPTTGATAGIVIFGDRNMPVGTSFSFGGGASEVLTGAVYVPKGGVKYGGGANDPNSCTQLIADTITFTGSANFALTCNGKGTKPLGSAAATLVE